MSGETSKTKSAQDPRRSQINPALKDTDSRGGLEKGAFSRPCFLYLKKSEISQLGSPEARASQNHREMTEILQIQREIISFKSWSKSVKLNRSGQLLMINKKVEHTHIMI